VNAAVNPFDPMAGHKTLWYWPRLAALRAAGERGATEALWFSVTTHLACGCVSNVFLVKDGRLLTPIARGEEVAGAIAAPVLPGVTRATVLAQAAELGIARERRDLSSKELVEADEVFLTNSSWGLLPVAMVESKPIGSGRPGPLTRSLLEHYRAAIARGDLTDGGSPAR
jgi:branched-subunit amino acid aminotransferase/4-amino-4-deoxychorismate lyase